MGTRAPGMVPDGRQPRVARTAAAGAGLGVKSVERLLGARRVRSLRKADILRLGVAGSKVLAFVQLPDHRPARDALDALVRARPHAGTSGATRSPARDASTAASAQFDLFAPAPATSTTLEASTTPAAAAAGAPA